MARDYSFPQGDTAESTAMRFVVGLDFGTTYTSVAFAHFESPGDVKLVQTWPDGSIGNNSADQVPTQVQYTQPGMVWGYQVSAAAAAPHARPLKWFKLLLQRNMYASHGQSPTPETDAPSQGVTPLEAALRRLTVQQLLEATAILPAPSPSPLPSYRFKAPLVTPDQKTRLILKELNLHPVTVVADFLRQVRETTMDSIKRTYWMEQELNSKVEWILTVPAMWSDSAKERMIQAARLAGLGERAIDFELISEPECGATYSLHAIQQHQLSPGDIFVLCDAGGGTVDLISYKVTANNPLRVDEVVAGSGALCGSVFLDQAFEQYMQCTLGNKIFGAMKPKAKEAMMRSWEEGVKFKFGNKTANSTYEVVVPGVADNTKMRTEDGFHSMRYEDVQGIFDPVVRWIIQLVDSQVTKVHAKGDTVKAILLVGGFGSSEYLMMCLASHAFGDQKIRVLQPVNARSAIARGALLRGLDGSIVMARRAPRHYGSLAHCLLTSDCPPGARERAYLCQHENVMTVPGMIQWYVEKGATIVPSHAGFYRLVRIQPNKEPDFIFEDPLYACDLDQAPDYEWQNPRVVYHVCTLSSDLRSIPRNKFPKYINNKGQQFYRVSYKLQMTLVNEVWKFELIFEGKCYGLVHTQLLE